MCCLLVGCGKKTLVFISLLWGVTNVFLIQAKGLAQPPSSNPLLRKITAQDPLIPEGYGNRELTSFEKYRIEKAITKLNLSAQEKLNQGNPDEAFELWYRQLKLTRTLDTELEIETLGKIGAIAWQENRGRNVRNIAERLIALQADLSQQDPLSSELLAKFATAYERVKYVDKVIAIYQQILATQADDIVARQKTLEILGKLYLSRFDYDNADKIYQELLTLMESEAKSLEATKIYLNTLIDIYDRTGKTEQAIVTKKLLAEKYTVEVNPSKIATLNMAIAQDYQTLQQTAKAIDYYERTVTIALKTQHFAIAKDALHRLGKIYQQNNNPKKAIATYNRLLKQQQQSYNHYGLINTYGILGEIHLELNQKSVAKQYFQQGLKLAKSLNHKVKYFNQKISQID